jgi:hypothetical protein
MIDFGKSRHAWPERLSRVVEIDQESSRAGAQRRCRYFVPGISAAEGHELLCNLGKRWERLCAHPEVELHDAGAVQSLVLTATREAWKRGRIRRDHPEGSGPPDPEDEDELQQAAADMFAEESYASSPTIL